MDQHKRATIVLAVLIAYDWGLLAIADNKTDRPKNSRTVAEDLRFGAGRRTTFSCTNATPRRPQLHTRTTIGPIMQSNFGFNDLSQRVAILGVILLLGVLIFGGGHLARSRTSQTAQWPSVTGRISRSKVVTCIGSKALKRVAKVEYQYKVGGRTYQGYRHRVIPMLHVSAPSPEKIVARYRMERSVVVCCDPDEPKDALLAPLPEEDAKRFIGILFLAGPCLGLIGLGMIVVVGPTPNSSLAETSALFDPTDP